MNTPTHFLMTAALRKALPKLNMPGSAVLIGSVAPDVPLYAMSFGAFLYYPLALGWSSHETAKHVFDTLYFHDPIWIACHSLLHSPVSLLLGLAAVRMLKKIWPVFTRWMTWFLLACLLHSAVDILTHHDDGPVLFWPFDWNYRFYSPVSYWDHRHFGGPASKFELILDCVLLYYLLASWLKRLVGRSSAVDD